jgi:cytochrome c oxidase subunit 2
MLGGAAIIFAGAVFFLAVGWVRRRRTGMPFLGDREPLATGLVLVFGIVIPILTLSALFAAANIEVLKDTNAPAASTTAMRIEVVGHQWFWEIRYPGTAAVTANELHIPTRTRINLVVHTADVIHSFWVPRLNRKIDLIPGRTNRILLEANSPGVYRGQCAEFCGLQHAHMAMLVFAQPPAQFRAWLKTESSPARGPTSGAETRGRQTFLSQACASCHAIRGTSAKGRIGPDLTHVGSRTTLAALTIPNNPAQMLNWIENPQTVKPGNKMPGLGLTPAQFSDISAYLESLK